MHHKSSEDILQECKTEPLLDKTSNYERNSL